MIAQNAQLKKISLGKRPDTPKVDMNAQNGLLEISGRSLPENAELFYEPIIEWIRLYIKNAPSKTIIKLELEYFNSSSVKQVLAILVKMEELLRLGKEVLVVWSYNEDDELMEMKGKELESIVELPFHLVAYNL